MVVGANYRVLICCTCHFQSSSFFVYFGFLHLQVSSVTNFCPDTGGKGDPLFRPTCSVVLWGWRNIANKYHWHVWGVLTVSVPLCAFPVYTTQVSGCSAGELTKAGPGLCALPRSKLLRFRFLGTLQRHRLGWACVLCPSQVRAAQATRCLARAHSPGGRCILSPPWFQPLGFPGAQQECHLRCVVCLLWGTDL